MAGRFPGARNVDEFWRNLCAGVESISFFTDAELLAAGVAAERFARPSYVRARGVLTGIEDFDAAFFGYSRREAELMDPQQRLFLECAYEALEDAGCLAESFAGPICLYGGTGWNNYLLANVGAGASADTADDYSKLVASDKDFLVTRVAYKLNLKGAAITVQTACSTSLVAVHLACHSLLSYECDAAVAGGVSICVPQQSGYLYQEGMVLSPDGHCRAFDARAQGAVFGSGAGVVVLKRLSDAVAAGDKIEAVILGSALNNDGAAKVGYTAPSVTGQAEVIALAHALAQVGPETITYVEGHGTATPLGDPIEVAALTQAFRVGTTRTGFCALGSVKTNVGHLDTAAGVAGLIKTVLALKHGLLPASRHFETPNPAIDFARSPFYVNTTLAEWRPAVGPRRAGVSSFGLGGTNAHIVLEEPPAPPTAAPSASGEPPFLLCLSARSPAAVAALARSYQAFLLDGGRDASLPDICQTAAARRRQHEFRIAAVGSDHADLARSLAGPWPEIDRPRLDAPVVAFVFPGQGSQWPGMGRQLFAGEPVFRACIERIAGRLAPLVDWSLLDELLAPPGAARVDRIDVVQPVLFAIQVALAELWRSWGIEPAAVVGHSMGEVAAAHVAGALSLDDALTVICRRSGLLRTVSGQGGMMLVELPMAEAERAVASRNGALSVAISNSPGATVISGDSLALDELRRDLEPRGIACFRIKVDVASHSPRMEPLRRPLLGALQGIRPSPVGLPMYSTVTGESVSGDDLDAGYWADNLRRPVLLAPVLERLLRLGVDAFVEISPHPILLPAVDDTRRAVEDRVRDRQQAAPRPVLALPSLRRDEPEKAVLLNSVGQLYRLGCAVRWPALFHGQGRAVALPAYPWQRERYWLEALPPPASARPAGVPAGTSATPSDGPSGTGTPDGKSGDAEAGDAQMTPTERRIAAIWRDVLRVATVAPEDDFFRQGGHSLLAVRLLTRIRDELGATVPLASFALLPTVAGLAGAVDQGARFLAWSPLVPIQPQGRRRPFFCVTPVMGTAFPYYRLAFGLDKEQPCFALQPPALDRSQRAVTRVEAMAAYYIDAIRTVQPRGPYAVGGWSFGAHVAYEMARQLEEQGERLDLVAAIDVPALTPGQQPTVFESVDFLVRRILARLGPYLRDFLYLQLAAGETTESGSRGSRGRWWHRWLGRSEAVLDTQASGILSLHRSGLAAPLRAMYGNVFASLRYRPRPSAVRVTLLKTRHPPRKGEPDPTWGWSELAGGGVELHDIPGEHMTLLQPPHVDTVAAVLNRCLDRAASERGNGDT